MNIIQITLFAFSLFTACFAAENNPAPVPGIRRHMSLGKQAIICGLCGVNAGLTAEYTPRASIVSTTTAFLTWAYFKDENPAMLEQSPEQAFIPLTAFLLGTYVGEGLNLLYKYSTITPERKPNN